MLNRMLKNHWCRLLAGNLSVGLLVVGIPVAVLLAMSGTLAVPTAGLIVLVFIHFALIGMQISRQGTWIPEKWLAAGYVFLPVIDVMQTVRWFRQDFWLEGIWAFVLAFASSFVTIWIAKNQWRKWKSPKIETVTINRQADHGSAHHADHDPTTMVY